MAFLCISVADPKYISSFEQAADSRVQAVIIPNTNPASGSTGAMAAAMWTDF